MKTEDSGLVSIIIPYFNNISTVFRSIESVVEQSYKYWELLIIDDCSDSPFSLGENLVNIDNRVELYRNNVNQGPGYSRQRGLEKSRGDFVCFLDSDDYYHKDYLYFMINKLKNHPECSGIYCTSLNVVENSVRKSSDMSYSKILPTIFDYSRPWATCSWLWRRSFLPDWNNVRSNEDSLFEINVAIKNNNIIHLNSVLCYIDKGTGRNTISVLGILKNELDRNYVVRYCIDNLYKFKEDRQAISEACSRRLLYVSARLLKLGQYSVVKENCKWFKYLASMNSVRNSVVLLLKLAVLFSRFYGPLGFKILEKYRIHYK